MSISQAFQLALQHHQAGRLAEAEGLYRQILAVEPHHADALHHLGIVAHHAGKGGEAVEWIRKAIAVTPDVPAYHSDLGEILRLQGRIREAVACCERATQLRPEYAEAHYNLGNALVAGGQFEKAVESYRETLRLAPGVAWAHNNLGAAFTQLGRYDEAAGAYRRAAELAPESADAHHNLGHVLAALGRLEEAADACRCALRLDPRLHGARNNLGNALGGQGLPDEAICEFRRALEIMPGFGEARSNLLYMLHYRTGADPAEIFAEHRRWDELHGKPLAKCIVPHGNARVPERPLRIGYVSPDFREHSAAFFLADLLTAHDPEKAEVFCYADIGSEDEFTSRFRLAAAHWRKITGVGDDEVAQMIRADAIDILVDLAGHTSGSRLLVFARKPAPVQVTYLGYPDTTGMNAMDYRLTDEHADPPGMTEHLHSEELVRLPETAWCYQPVAEAPPVGALPAAEAGHVTFGSFNAMAKITAEMLVLWARLLAKVPGSRLVLKNMALGERAVRERVHRALEREGIAPDRVDLLGRMRTLAEHLGAYGALDIALDTFPYHGTTTTCEALWMGVPVVTLAGRTHVSRVGVSLLKNVGMPELIASSEDDYVSIAVKLAADVARLAELRATMRGRMWDSVLMDAPRFARNVEAAYREMWRAWCAGGKPEADGRTVAEA